MSPRPSQGYRYGDMVYRTEEDNPEYEEGPHNHEGRLPLSRFLNSLDAINLRGASLLNDDLSHREAEQGTSGTNPNKNGNQVHHRNQGELLFYVSHGGQPGHSSKRSRLSQQECQERGLGCQSTCLSTRLPQSLHEDCPPNELSFDEIHGSLLKHKRTPETALVNVE
jgi:hypothetical protein